MTVGTGAAGIISDILADFAMVCIIIVLLDKFTTAYCLLNSRFGVVGCFGNNIGYLC